MLLVTVYAMSGVLFTIPGVAVTLAAGVTASAGVSNAASGTSAAATAAVLLCWRARARAKSTAD